MKKGPDLITMVVLAFIVGTLATEVVAQTDFQLSHLVAQVFNQG